MNDISLIRDLVNELRQDTWHTFAGRDVRQESLLTRLRDSIRASVGRTRGGNALPMERNALNLGAFRVYEDITGRIASMSETATDLPPDRDPRTNITRWFDALELAWLRGQLEEQQVKAALRTVRAFVIRIRDLYDPPTESELIGACPNPLCGETRWRLDLDGNETTALYTEHRPGEPVTAKCRWCDSRWTDIDELSQLGQQLGTLPYGPLPRHADIL